MTLWGDLILLRPWWLLALPVLLGLALYLRRRRAGLGDWEKVIDPGLLDAMRMLGRVTGDRAGRIAGNAMLIALGVIVLALSGPATERRGANSFRNLDAVVFVVDVSPSVLEGQDWQEFLTLARAGVVALGTRPAGLVVYAGDAYVAHDLTADTDQIGLTLSLLEPGVVPDAGSRPERGLKLAADMLAQGAIIAGDVVLLSDGGGLDAASLVPAARIAEAGARLSLVQPQAAQSAISTRLTAASDGALFDPAEVESFMAFLREDARTRLERQDFPLEFHADHGRWLLPFALLPVLLVFRRRRTT